MKVMDDAIIGLFQKAADFLSPWIGCYRLALIVHQLAFAISICALVAANDWIVRTCYAVGVACFFVNKQMASWELKAMEHRFNIVPLARLHYLSVRYFSMAFALFLSGGIFSGGLNLSDKIIAGYWTLFCVAQYFGACIQRQPPAKKYNKSSLAFI